MHRFFVPGDSIEQGYVVIRGSEAKHLSRVLRLRAGDQALVFDGSGRELVVRIETCSGTEVRASVLEERHPDREPPVAVSLVQGIGKGEKMDFIVQKSVELGITRIIPVMTEWGTVRLTGQRAGERVHRWRKIAVEACKQCGRTVIPEVEEIRDFYKVVEETRDTPGILFYEGFRDRSLKEVLRQKASVFRDRGLVLYVGAEGGFSPREIEEARNRGLIIAGLGPRILRTETAALAAVTCVLYELGDLGGTCD